MSMQTEDCSAISLRVVARPPRVGSRRTWTSPQAVMMSAIMWLRGAESEATSVRKDRPSRLPMTVRP